MIVTAFIATWFLGPHELKSLFVSDQILERECLVPVGWESLHLCLPLSGTSKYSILRVADFHKIMSQMTLLQAAPAVPVSPAAVISKPATWQDDEDVFSTLLKYEKEVMMHPPRN